MFFFFFIIKCKSRKEKEVGRRRGEERARRTRGPTSHQVHLPKGLSPQLSVNEESEGQVLLLNSSPEPRISHPSQEEPYEVCNLGKAATLLWGLFLFRPPSTGMWDLSSQAGAESTPHVGSTES